MSNSKNQILVQTVENFEIINRLTVARLDSKQTITQRVDQYLKKNPEFGIVSLEDDADGEYAAVLLVAAAEGPDFMMDMATGEMEAVEKVDPAVERELKMDIMMEINNDLDDDVIINPTAWTPVSADEQKKLAAAVNIVAKLKSKPVTSKQYNVLAGFIKANPGVSRTTIISDAGLLSSLRTPSAIKLIAAGDKGETKRWNRRLNFLIRDMRRGGVEIQVERKGRVAHYTIANVSQLELPFGVSVGKTVDTNVVVQAPKVDTKRVTEPANVSLGFEDLLAQLDEDEATVLTDDQVAFNAAREMIK